MEVSSRGSAIRVPFRLQILSNMIAMITVALILQNWYERFRAAGSWHGGPLLLGVMMPVFLAEQVNLTLNSGVQRRDELAELAAVPQPLSDCRVFYVIHEVAPAVVGCADRCHAHIPENRRPHGKWL